MTDTEQKSYNTQLKLAKDIIRANGTMNYCILQSAKSLRELLSNKKYNEKEKEVVLSKEDFDKIIDIVYSLQDERKWDKLGILAPAAMDEIRIKTEIFNQLQ